MTQNDGDRRVRRTRKTLQDALIDLILEKGYEAVVIQDILDRADVGRSTFYAHYQDKEDLLMSRFASLQAAFEEHAQFVLSSQRPNVGNGSDMQFNLPLFVLRYVENEHRLFKALLGKRGSGRHAVHFQVFLLKYTRDLLKTYAHAQLSSQQFEIVAQYLTSTFLALLVWWVDGDMPCSVEELYALMMRLIEPGLKNVLDVPTLWS